MTSNKISITGLTFLLGTAFGWGLSWPVLKYLLQQWPPFSTRGWTGVAGGVLLALYALLMGISLNVPREQWFRLAVSTFLNVTLWMATMGYALLFLPASEATVLAYTMPVWTALLAWPLLGERMTFMRVIALVMAFAGLVALFGGAGITATVAKLPGIGLALVGAFGFALGTIFLKRSPLQLPGATSAAWQIFLGCLPVALLGLAFERPALDTLTAGGWAGMAYVTFGQFIAYACWFAALERLPASIAAIGTMLVPVIGVTGAALALGEPLGAAKIAALILVLAGVALAARS